VIWRKLGFLKERSYDAKRYKPLVKVQNFKEAVLKAVEAYNRYRTPEANAKFIQLDRQRLIVDFEGSFCRTCGTYDYLEDFIYELRRFVDVTMKIANFERQGPETFRVIYTL
jgi:hypothetical protein